MEPFAISISLTPLQDGNKIGIVDQSNYVTNTDGITAASFVSRAVIVKGSDGSVFATVLMVNSGNGIFQAIVSVDKDRYFEYGIKFIKPDSTFITSTIVNTSNDIGYLLAAKNYVNINCKKKCGDANNFIWGILGLNVAKYYGDYGSPQVAQSILDDANKLLALNCC